MPTHNSIMELDHRVRRGKWAMLCGVGWGGVKGRGVMRRAVGEVEAWILFGDLCN